MGLDNRDYIRQSQRHGIFGDGGTWPAACKALIAINVAVFLLQIFTTPPHSNFSPIQNWFQLDDRVLSGQVWRLVTCAFCHSTTDFFHLVFNMLGIVFFGRTIERKLGTREFLAFYFSAALLASFAHVGLELMTGGIVPAIGASGAVVAILILFALYFPRQEVLLFFCLPVQIRWVALFIVAGDLFPVLTSFKDKGQGFGDGIAHAAHLGGIIFAFAYWKWNLSLAPIFNKISPVRPNSSGGKKKPKSSGLSVTGRSKAEIDRKVDELLEKISEKGFQSLSAKEKEFMSKASDKFGKP